MNKFFFLRTSPLDESVLVTGEAKDVTSEFTGSPGLIKTLRTTEADISEYKTEKHAKKYHNPDLNSYAVNNIYVLIKQGQGNADNFVKVLKSGQGVKELETTYAWDAQKAFVESMDKADFVTYVDAF